MSDVITPDMMDEIVEELGADRAVIEEAVGRELTEDEKAELRKAKDRLRKRKARQADAPPDDEVEATADVSTPPPPPSEPPPPPARQADAPPAPAPQPAPVLKLEHTGRWKVLSPIDYQSSKTGLRARAEIDSAVDDLSPEDVAHFRAAGTIEPELS